MTGFYLKKRGVLAFGLAKLESPAFIVCAGSNIRNSQAGNMSIYRKEAFLLRRKLINNGTISKDLIFLSSHEFRNVSMATSVILGGSRSGGDWFNAKSQSYPDWKTPNRKRLSILFRKGSRFVTNSNETFLIRDVVPNRDVNNKIVYEYLLRPSGGRVEDEFLIPERELIKSLKEIIKKEMR